MSEVNNHIIIFDGICNLCNFVVQFVIKRDKKNIFKFLPLQSQKAKEMIKRFHGKVENLESVILIQDSIIYYESDAVIKISQLLNYPWKIFCFFKFIPKFVRDRIYKMIARNRYNWFGKRETCMIPTKEQISKFL